MTNSDLEKDMQTELDKEFGATRLRVALPKADLPSVVQQLLGVAETLKGIHKDIDDLEKEFSRRLNELRKRLGDKG